MDTAKEIKIGTPEGLEEKPKPLMVLPASTETMARPDGAVLEVTLFHLVDPTTNTKLMTQDAEGQYVPVTIVSMPVVTKVNRPAPRIIRPNRGGRS